MEFLHSTSLFVLAVVKRSYFLLPPLLLDPFDLLGTLFGIDYNPPTWVAWGLFSLGLFVAASWAYHDIRKTVVFIEADDVDSTIAKLKAKEFLTADDRRLDVATILNALGVDLANGLKSTAINLVLQQKLDVRLRFRAPDNVAGELRLANIISHEYRQPAQADSTGTYQSPHAMPYTMFYLTPFGVKVVTKLREEMGEALEPRNTLVFEPIVVRDWVHLSVKNTGETDNFVAQVKAVIGVEDMTLPWSMKWRQWEGEERRIIKGQTQLIDLALLDHNFTHPQDPDALQGVYYYYHLISTTARFQSRGRVVGYLSKSDMKTLVDTVEEATLERCLALLVGVRGVASRSVGQKWVSLGFKPDGTPVVSLADQQPQLTTP